MKSAMQIKTESLKRKAEYNVIQGEKE